MDHPLDQGDNVVPLKTGQPSREGWGQREAEALLLARLAAMPLLEYERTRLAGARELKCRVSWLDRLVENIRFQAAMLASLPPAQDGRTNVGTPINFFHDNGKEVLGFLVASAHQSGKDRHLLVLADGNGMPSTPSPYQRRAFNSC
jgi:hypothetical protein